MIQAKRQPALPDNPLRVGLIASGFIVVVGLAVILLIFAGAASPPTLRLVYTSGGTTRLYNLATGEDVYLAAAEQNANQRAVSPDERYRASWRNLEDGYALWQLTITPRDDPLNAWTVGGVFRMSYPTLSWSPDSRTLAFASTDLDDRGGPVFFGSELLLLDVETGQVTPVTDNDFAEVAPAFSPDGRRLAFTSYEDGYARLYTLDLASGVRRLLTPGAFGYTPAWSPDGHWIAFSSTHEAYDTDVYVIRTDGSGLRRLTFTTTDDGLPRWLP